MKLKKQIQLNHLIYLHLLQSLDVKNTDFMDNLIHIYRSIRLKTKWKVNKTFVSSDFNVVDPEKEQILQSLLFFQYIDKAMKPTPLGMKYLENQKYKNDTLNEIIQEYPNNDNIAFQNTCLSPSFPTAANCGLCKNLICMQNPNLFDTFSGFIKVKNYQKSYSKK